MSYFNAQKAPKPGQRTTSQTWVSTNALSQNWGWVTGPTCHCFLCLTDGVQVNRVTVP